MPIEWTDEELAAILSQVDIPGDRYDEKDLLLAIGEAIDLEGLTASLFVGTGSEAIREAALAQANRQARQIAGNLAQAELNTIAEKVAQNLAEGKNFEGLFGKLSEISGLDKNRAATLENYKAELERQGVSGAELALAVEAEHDRLLRDRRRTIALTEQRFATEAAAILRAKNRGAQFKRWLTVGDDRVSDACQSNEAEGYIQIDKSFGLGSDTPPEHPNCRCSLTFRTFPPDAAADRRVDQDVEQTATAKAE